MKKTILIWLAFSAIQAQSQNWESTNYPGGFVNTVDTFQNKLCLAGNGYVKTFDGTTWTELQGYNNGSNTPNKSKYAARNINNLLYMGAKDFNTNGEGVIHTFDGSNFMEKQGFRQFQYNANKKIIDFVKVGGTIYTSDGFGLYEWRDTSTSWRYLHATPNISKMNSFNNKLVYTNGTELYFYDGVTLDSMGFSNMTPTNGKYMFCSVSDIKVQGNFLFASGSFVKFIDVATQQADYGNIFKYDGTNATMLKANFSSTPTQNNMARINRIFVDDNNDIYAIGLIDPNVNDVYFIKYNGNAWSSLDKICNAGQGLYPTIPGSEIADYNIIYKYGGNLFVSGRFEKIAGISMINMAKWKGNMPNGINEVRSKKLSIYPNPSTHMVSFEGIDGELSINIYNLNGQLQGKFETQNGQWNSQNLPSGVYQIQAIDSNGRTYSNKLIKE